MCHVSSCTSQLSQVDCIPQLPPTWAPLQGLGAIFGKEGIVVNWESVSISASYSGPPALTDRSHSGYMTQTEPVRIPLLKFWNIISVGQINFAEAYCCLVAKSCPTLATPWRSPPGSSVHGIFPGKNTGVGCHFLLQGIFLTEGLNPGLLHCRRILYHWGTKEALCGGIIYI